MFVGKTWRNTGIGTAMALALAVLPSVAMAAVPHNWELGMQPAATPVQADIEAFNHELDFIIFAICGLVFAILIYSIIRFRARANPVPSKTSHNTLLEVAWTLVPVIILVVIAVPSLKLLYYMRDIPKPDVVIEAIGHQWYWTYNYPGSNGGFTFDSLVLTDAQAAQRHEPRLLGVDNAVVVPVNKVVEVETTGADVIHSWAVPAFGVKMDAIPGRINHTWFKATKLGTYYGECSELCGARHAFMPIEVHVVTEAQYAAWLASAKKKFAALDDATVRVAAK